MKDFLNNAVEALRDPETGKVLAATAISWVSLEHVHILLEVLASLGATVYIWRKIYRNKD